MSLSVLKPSPDELLEFERERIARFLERFSCCGLPSERSLVKRYILWFVRANGFLPYGWHPVIVEDGAECFWGRNTDFTEL